MCNVYLKSICFFKDNFFLLTNTLIFQLNQQQRLSYLYLNVARKQSIKLSEKLTSFKWGKTIRIIFTVVNSVNNW